MKSKKNYIFIILVLFFLTVLISCDSDENSNTIEEPPYTYIPSDLNVPNRGLLNKSILITGKNIISDSLVFYFDDKLAQSYQKGIDSINVIVPRNIERYNPNILIYNRIQEEAIHSSSFKLFKPEIIGVADNEITFGDEVTVYGHNFDVGYNFVKVFLNDTEIQLTDLTYDFFKFVIPNNIETNEFNIKIESQLQEASYENLFHLKQPIITSVSDNVRILSIITIHGENFNPNIENSTIMMNGEIPVNINRIIDRNTIEILVPVGPFDDFVINSISYETANMQTSYNQLINITPPYILGTRNHPFYIKSSFYTYNNNLYVLGTEKIVNTENEDTFEYIWKFDNVTKTWNKISNYSINTWYDSISGSTVDYNNGYMYIYQNTDNNKFIRINLNTYEIETLNTISNFIERGEPVIFYYNNKIYFGKGRHHLNNNFLYDLYTYDISSDTWTEVNTDSNRRTLYQVLYLNNEVYFQNKRSGGLTKFNPSDNSFTNLETSSYGSYMRNYFIINNKIIKSIYNAPLERLYFYDLNNNLLNYVPIYFTYGTNKVFSFNNRIYFKAYLINNPYASTSNGYYLIHNNITSNF